ncbi:MAG TPA: hypothetical protein VJB87_02240 [Candidatus Nanoarchaeia archaeon]|nr:hypothetical protein [Candidatus Nanoarchaeia archaeon]
MGIGGTVIGYRTFTEQEEYVLTLDMNTIKFTSERIYGRATVKQALATLQTLGIPSTTLANCLRADLEGRWTNPHGQYSFSPNLPEPQRRTLRYDELTTILEKNEPLRTHQIPILGDTPRRPD